MSGSGGAIRVLHVDDESDGRAGVAASLEREHEALTVTSEPSASAGLERLRSETFDCIVSGYMLPDMDGLAFLRAVRARRPDIPFVLCTEHGSEAVASKAISAGVTEYLQKRGGTVPYRELATLIDRSVAEYRATTSAGEVQLHHSTVSSNHPETVSHSQNARELERYETIMQAVGDPVYTLDEDGYLTVVNDAVEALSGYDRDELVGEHISKIMTTEDVRAGERLIAELVTHGDQTNRTFEMDIITADGKNVPCENHIALLPADDGDFRGTAGVIRDISERKQRERQLEQFASVVSHDLRSPLNVVQGRVDHVRSSGDLTHLDDAADAARQMERLIDDLLTLAHEGQRVGDPEPVSLAVAARDAWEHLQSEESTLEIETDQRVDADFERLRELFDNLFCNAIDHGDAETVQLSETDDGFAVADDGVGIPADRRDSVFERGFTTSEDGTGFGLAIVETIAEAHDWSITVSESERGGACFEIEM